MDRAKILSVAVFNNQVNNGRSSELCSAMFLKLGAYQSPAAGVSAANEMALTEWSLDQTMRIGDPLLLGLIYLIGLVSAEIKLQYKYDRKEDFVAYAGIYMDP